MVMIKQLSTWEVGTAKVGARRKVTDPRGVQYEFELTRSRAGQLTWIARDLPPAEASKSAGAAGPRRLERRSTSPTTARRYTVAEARALLASVPKGTP